MAIEKLDYDFSNRGSHTEGDRFLNASTFQNITNKIDEIIDYIQNQSAITASISANTDVGPGDTNNAQVIIPLSKVMSSNGSKFQFDANKHEVKILSGVSKIKVSAHCSYQLTSGGLFGLVVLKNKVAIGTSYSNTSENNYHFLASTPIYTEVKEGDIISVYLYIAKMGDVAKVLYYEGSGTILTIEEVL